MPNQPLSCRRLLPENMQFLSSQIPWFLMKSDGSLPRSQQPPTRSCPRPHHYTLSRSVSLIFMLIFLPSMSRSSGIPTNIRYAFPVTPVCYTGPAYPIPLYFLGTPCWASCPHVSLLSPCSPLNVTDQPPHPYAFQVRAAVTREGGRFESRRDIS
jgi:hypothetical protein